MFHSWSIPHIEQKIAITKCVKNIIVDIFWLKKKQFCSGTAPEFSVTKPRSSRYVSAAKLRKYRQSVLKNICATFCTYHNLLKNVSDDDINLIRQQKIIHVLLVLVRSPNLINKINKLN